LGFVLEKIWGIQFPFEGTLKWKLNLLKILIF